MSAAAVRRPCVRSLARLPARLRDTKCFVREGKLVFLTRTRRDERGLCESARMIKGKQTGAGTKHNEIIRDVVAVVVCLFFPCLSPLFSCRLVPAVRVYFQNEDAEPSAKACRRSFGDSDGGGETNRSPPAIIGRQGQVQV